MRLHVVSQQIAWAELRAEAALIASRLPDAMHGFERTLLAHHQVMVARQDDDRARSLSDHVVEIEGQRAHHQSADENGKVGSRGAAGQRQQVAEGRTDGRAHRNGMLYCATDRQEFLGHGLALRSAFHVVERLNVVHYTADGQRDPAGGNQSPRRQVDQFVFIA